jgi:hypothetical protein
LAFSSFLLAVSGRRTEREKKRRGEERRGEERRGEKKRRKKRRGGEWSRGEGKETNTIMVIPPYGLF